MPQGFLITSLNWENITATDVTNFNGDVLEQLKTKLNDELMYHVDGTMLKKRTMQLLNLTNELINSRPSLGWNFWQKHPSEHEILIYSIILILSLALFSHFLWTRHQTNIHRQHFKNLSDYLRLVKPTNPPKLTDC